MKAMLSQPMAGKTEEEIIKTREKAIKALEDKGYKIVNTLFTDEWYSQEKMKERGVAQIPLCFLAKSLENMSLCHAAYFCKGWENARGCRLEHEAAVTYGLEIIYEEENHVMSTKIMGQAQASVEQMRAYIKKVNPKAPESVLAMIPLYITEGALEGVRGDVTFAQSCLETGNFTFKGSAVTLDQNNFCGMGVTSTGDKGKLL